MCIALVSGGLDSPVAIARALKQGWNIYPVHCSQEPVVGPEAEQKTIAALQHFLTSKGPIGDAARAQIHPSLTVVPVAEHLALFTEKWAHTEYFIHMKRMYHHLADFKASDVGATHLLKGESLGPEVCGALGPNTPVTIANQEWLEKSEQRAGGLHEICQAAWDNRREVSL